MAFNILNWCDNKISELKKAGIEIRDGIAIIPKSSIYMGVIKMITPFNYRKDIPIKLRKESVLCNFMPDKNVFVRLAKIEQDYKLLKEYGGVCGQDLSISIGMLKPRQKFSIFINSIYNCSLAIKGIKILPNSRVGELETIELVSSFPDKVSFITGMHGCKKYGFKDYGLYITRLIVRKKRPSILYVYGNLSMKEARRLFWCNEFKIITFPDRRNRIRNHAQPYLFYCENNKIKRISYNEYLVGGVA